MWSDNYETLRYECQICGTLGPEYDDAIRQSMAANPYNYVWFCDSCMDAEYHFEEEYKWQ